VSCKVTGDFIKIQGKKEKALHFCGLKIWTVSATEEVMDYEMDEPEPIGMMMSSTGFEIIPELLHFKKNQISMSSKYNHKKNKAWNPVKSTDFNPNWGKGQFTCMHT